MLQIVMCKFFSKKSQETLCISDKKILTLQELYFKQTNRMEKQTTYTVKGNSFWSVAVFCVMLLGSVFAGTNAANATCTPPSGLSITNVTGSAATLNWTINGLVTRFEVQTRDSLSSTWVNARTNVLGNATSYRVGSDVALMPNKTYQLRIRAICTNNSTIGFTRVLVALLSKNRKSQGVES